MKFNSEDLIWIVAWVILGWMFSEMTGCVKGHGYAPEFQAKQFKESK